jgi:hypothetical protein
MGALLIAACASPPRKALEVSRSVAGSPERAREQAAARLRSLGFAVEALSDAGVAATSSRAADDWADCGTVITVGGENRSQRDFAKPTARGARVEIRTVAGPDGTRVELTTSFDGTYYNRFRGLSFHARCESTGALEGMLLDAAAGS